MSMLFYIAARPFRAPINNNASDTEAAFLDLHLSISNDRPKLMTNVTTLILKLSISHF